VAENFPCRGAAFYDDQTVHANYLAVRAQPDEPNALLEDPAVRDFVGDPAGLSVLELGCGDGRYARELLAAGVRAYSGIDGSARMVAAARAAVGADERASVVHADLDHWEPDVAEVDVVVARMVLHDVDDLERLLRQSRACLATGGTFTFSVEHPVITSNYAQPDGAPRARTWQVSGYFDEGRRTCRWLGAEVVKHHRTVERYLSLLSGAGFALSGFSEGRPQQGHFDSQERYQAMRDVPFYLIIRGIAR
jgi:SAM-dependent methyltransferase